jgi:hypothetical protein
VTCNRGPFHVIEVWVENDTMVEVLPPDFAAEYLAWTRPDTVATRMASAPGSGARHARAAYLTGKPQGAPERSGPGLPERSTIAGWCVGFSRAVVRPGWLHRLAVPLPAAKGSLKLLPCDLGWMATVWLPRARVNRTEQN